MGRCASRPIRAESMASDEVPPSNLGDEVTDTEHEYEDDVEGEEGHEAEGGEGQEEQGRASRGIWEGSYITQSDIDRLC